METYGIEKYGITGTTEIVYNPSYEQLFEEETKPGLTGYEVGKPTELGAVNVMTGIYTGRSPKDKYIVMDENSKNTVWWTSDEYKNDNHPMSESTWAAVKALAQKELSNKKLYVVDAFCGANHDTRMAVRFIVEVAWQAHFVTNMFIRPTEEELANFKPDFVVYNASKVVNQQIFYIACISMMVLAVFLLVVLLSGGFFMKSIMVPVAEITEKARRIASGSYGAQIQTRYDDEIRDLADTINEMSTKISQNEKMQAEFISQLSHELRTPLTVINGWSETLLADERMDDETRQGMKIISSEAKRLTGMVTELLDFTRMQDGRMTLNVELTDIRSEFEDTVYMYSSRLAQDGITLEYLENDGDIPEIPCDGQRLRQVFLNVLDNAAKHGRDGKRIEASISYENDQVVVRIRDFGPGIPEDELGLVKKKFYKGSSKARGTGIGLAVCEEIMELHNGSLTLENAPGGGTLVTISLPASQ